MAKGQDEYGAQYHDTIMSNSSGCVVTYPEDVRGFLKLMATFRAEEGLKCPFSPPNWGSMAIASTVPPAAEGAVDGDRTRRIELRRNSNTALTAAAVLPENSSRCWCRALLFGSDAQTCSPLR